FGLREHERTSLVGSQVTLLVSTASETRAVQGRRETRYREYRSDRGHNLQVADLQGSGATCYPSRSRTAKGCSRRPTSPGDPLVILWRARFGPRPCHRYFEAGSVIPTRTSRPARAPRSWSATSPKG